MRKQWNILGLFNIYIYIYLYPNSMKRNLESELVLLFIAKRRTLLHNVVQIGAHEVNRGMKLHIFEEERGCRGRVLHVSAATAAIR